MRASLAMARLQTDGQPVSINSLAEYEDISAVFLEQIFFKLRKAGIVSSVRGPGGGFYFAHDLDKVTVKQIFDAVGEKLDVTYCKKRNDHCIKVNGCLSHKILLDANELVKEYFSNITLASILEKE